MRGDRDGVSWLWREGLSLSEWHSVWRTECLLLDLTECFAKAHAVISENFTG